MGLADFLPPGPFTYSDPTQVWTCEHRCQSHAVALVLDAGTGVTAVMIAAATPAMLFLALFRAPPAEAALDFLRENGLPITVRRLRQPPSSWRQKVLFSAAGARSEARSEGELPPCGRQWPGVCRLLSRRRSSSARSSSAPRSCPTARGLSARLLRLPAPRGPRTGLGRGQSPPLTALRPVVGRPGPDAWVCSRQRPSGAQS
jgi:hypothetical protein